MHDYKLAEVFGVGADLPRTYVERESIDHLFRASLDSDHIVVIHGNSKQGKTCLMSKWIHQAQDPISCTPGLEKGDLYGLILNSFDISLPRSERRLVAEDSSRDQGKKISLGKLGDYGTAQSQTKRDSRSKEVVGDFAASIDYDPNTIVHAFRRAQLRPHVVIEDFHRLRSSVQTEVINDLKVFFDHRLPFVILGVWHNEDRLSSVNGDLDARVVSINVNDWVEADFLKILDLGSTLLNVQFSPKVADELIGRSMKNVGILQEAVWRMCVAERIMGPSRRRRSFDEVGAVDDAIVEISDRQRTRLFKSLHCLAESCPAQLVDCFGRLLSEIVRTPPNELQRGVSDSILAQRASGSMPRREALGQFRQALDLLRELQRDCGVEPPIFEYYNGDLSIVDSRFLLFLANYDRNRFLRELGLSWKVSWHEKAAATTKRKTCEWCGWKVPEDVEPSRSAEALREHIVLACPKATSEFISGA